LSRFFLSMIKAEDKITIKSWAPEDRPREKMLLYGRRHLSDAELLAILIGTGNRNENAVSLSQRILSACGNDLDRLCQLSVKDLTAFSGVGRVKALHVIAALEIGRRRTGIIPAGPQKIDSSHDAYRHLHPIFTDLDHEEFWILLLNQANYVKSKHMISKGGRAGTVADPKIIFKTAIDNQGTFIILAHNHPSGNLRPSKEDLFITRKLADAGKLLDLLVLDHLILVNGNYYSLADEGCF